MNKENLSKAKTICEMYHEGNSLTVISKAMGNQVHCIYEYLKKYYPVFYNEDYKSFSEKQSERDDELYKEFKKIYVPFTQTRKKMCEMLNCSCAELEHMFKKYDIKYLRLQTYKDQRTLCNVPNENYDEYFQWAKDHNMSMRTLACIAINEYILRKNQEG